MEFVESLTSGLPPSRDDEPPGLRQDIIDELADHLACSLQRELLRGGDPSAAALACSFDSATRRPWPPALARCDEGEDHGSQWVIGT